MNALAISLLTLGCVFAGALLGLALHQRLPEHHRSPESMDAVKLVTGLLATLSALVLGLLIASAKSSFDSVEAGLTKRLASVIVIDRLLAEYGPEAVMLRQQLKRRTEAGFAGLLGAGHGAPADAAVMEAASSFDAGLYLLVPADERQRALLGRIQSLSDEVRRTHWLMMLEQSNNSVAPLFLVVIVSWLTAMFVSFGLFAPRNWTTLSALFVGAAAVATAIFLMEEMYRPLDGLITIPREQIRHGLALLGR